MKLRVVTLFAALGLSCYAPAALAQGTPTQPPPATSTPTQPPPNVVVITPQGQSTVPGQPVAQPGTLGPVPPDKVRVHLRSYRPKDTARLYIEQGTDRWALACTSPCGIDLRPGASLRVTYNDDVESPHDFSLQTEGGREIQVLVKPASKGALAGGIVMISTGGVTALCGLLVLALSDLSRSSRDRSQAQVIGGVVTALGAGLVIGGIVLLANRSREPRITQESTPPGGPPPSGAIDVPVRSAFLDDGKLATSPSAPGILPAPQLPVGWGFAF